jgi:hypothetical protein
MAIGETSIEIQWLNNPCWDLCRHGDTRIPDTSYQSDGQLGNPPFLSILGDFHSISQHFH